MNKTQSMLTGLVVSVVGFSGGTLAQEPAAAAPAAAAPAAAASAAADRATPVEMYACNLRDGKDMGDLAKINVKFKAMMAENKTAYSAWMLTPQLRSGEGGFDVGWLGSWADGASMGAAMDSRMSGPAAEMLKGYEAIMDCSAGHMLMVSETVHAPDGPPDNGVVLFSSCEVAEGSNMDAAVAAHVKVSAGMRKRGGKGSSWLFYPALGFGAVDFDYYEVVAFENYAGLGESFELMTNGGAWEANMKVFKGVTSCDSPRVYDARLVSKPAAS